MATKYGGYMGKVVWLDLTKKQSREYPWTDELREKYIGGKMMAAKILCDHLTGREKPFSEENIVVVSTGPMTGTGAPSSSRFNLSCLSPQTGIITSSNCGGNFGYFLKKAGMDALIISGRCDSHTWIEIDNEKFVFHDADADGLWGLRVSETQERIKSLLEDKWEADRAFGQIVIGPAGENLVLYSAVISGERAAGRAGVGAVLGWKNIKGIAVTGNHEFTVHDPAKMREWNKKWIAYLRSHPLTGKQLPRLGTAGLVAPMQKRGLLATKNYSAGKFDDYEKVSGEALAEKHNIVNKGCLTCPIRCARTVRLDGREIKGPELETLGLLSGGILNNDLEKVIKWNHELDEWGLDTISCANTIAYAMEANEKGIWKNGLEFGKTEGLCQVFEDIALRRGLGDELAQGSRRLSEKYGGKEFAMQVKGLELAAYEPRRAVGQGLGYAVSNRGGCHLNGGYLVILEGLGLFANPQTARAKADFTMMFQNLMEMISATGQCLFTSYAFFPGFLLTKPDSAITKFVNKIIPGIGWAVRGINRFPLALAIHLPVFHHTKGFKYATGMKMNFGRYLRCGERGYTLERYVSARFGVGAKDDALPKRLTDEPQDPARPDTRVPLDQMKKTYYRARGWDEKGLPTEKTLKKLGIK